MTFISFVSNVKASWGAGSCSGQLMRKTLVIAFGLALLSSMAWLAIDRPATDDDAMPAPPPEQSVRETPAVAGTELPVPAARTAGDIPAVSSDPDEWEVVEYGDFVRVREYRRDCETSLHFLGTGAGDEVTTCERKFEIDHPYALFTDAQLAQIAGTDGEAAFILAQRRLFPSGPGRTQDIENGVNNVLDAMIRGAEGQALDLLLDETVFSPHTDLRSFLLWSMVGERLGIASPEQNRRLGIFRDAAALADIEAIEQKAAEIAGLLKEQRLIVLGTEF